MVSAIGVLAIFSICLVMCSRMVKQDGQNFKHLAKGCIVQSAFIFRVNEVDPQPPEAASPKAKDCTHEFDLS